jgi:4-hydroxyphenylacetate 3-monooxygenase
VISINRPSGAVAGLGPEPKIFVDVCVANGHGSVNENWVAEDRRKLLAFAWGLLISDHAGHRLPFAAIAQSPLFARLNAVHNIFDFSGPLNFFGRAADLSERTMKRDGAMVGRDRRIGVDAGQADNADATG